VNSKTVRGKGKVWVREMVRGKVWVREMVRGKVWEMGKVWEGFPN
jgi:hypothetical protein